MKQSVTIEIRDNAVLKLLQNLATLNLISFKTEPDSKDDSVTARLNEIYKEEESSLEPCYYIAQNNVIGREDW